MAAQKKQRKDSLALLKSYVQKSKYIAVHEQRTVCESFGLPYVKSIFRNEYRQRFYNYLHEYTTTVADTSNTTSMPEKLLCYFKATLEKKGQLKLIGIGVCPDTYSGGVQFLSTNKDKWTRKV